MFSLSLRGAQVSSQSKRHAASVKCVCVCVCVCGSGKPYVMGTKCPHKDGNIQNPCPCGDIFWSP